MARDYQRLSREELIRLLEASDQHDTTHVTANESERYRNLVEQASDGIFIADEQGVYLDVNESGARMLGMTREEVIGRRITDILPEEEFPKLAEDLEKLRAGLVIVREYRVKRKDGSFFPGEVSAKKLSDGRLQGILRDITLRKQGEEVLRQSEERFRNLTAAAFEGIGISEGGRVVDVNDQLARMLGYEREELIGREVMAMIAPESRELVAQAMKSGREGPYEHFAVRKDGTVFEAEVRAKTIEWSGRTLRVTAVRDISGRKRAEQALRESEEKFAKAFRASPDAIAISDLETGQFIEINDGYLQVFGYTREEALGRTSLELGLWESAADRTRLTERLRKDGVVRDFEACGRNRRGQQIHCSISAEIIEIGGRPRIVSVVHDLTARVQAEAALRASEETLRATIEYTPHVAVQWFDAQGRVVFWNQASERIYGWTAAQAHGKTLGELIFAPAEAERFAQALASLKGSGKAVGPIEFGFRHRDGSHGVVLSTIFRIPDLGGAMRFVCMDVDVTDRKAAEQSLRQAQARELRAREEFARDLLNAQEAERRRFATELHDSLGQNLLLIKNRAQLALAGTAIPPDLRQQLDNIRDAATLAIAEVRQISHDLRPYQLDQLGLTGALGALIESTGQSTAIVFERKLELVDDAFTPDQATNLYRVVQESLSNVLKHSGAKHARIVLERDVHHARLRIEDDGKGFEPAAAKVIPHNGFGLRNIAERVRILGGTLKLDSSPGQGTRIEVVIPIPDAD